MSIIDRVAAFAGTEQGKALDFAHGHFQERLGVHGHSGRALIETVAEVARNHPAAMGFVVGVAVEQLLAHEKHHYEETHHPGLAQLNDGAAPARAQAHGAAHPHAGEHPFVIRLANVKPGKLAFEMFAALVLLKLGAAGARMFRRKSKGEVWFAPAARIHLWSATFATYHGAKALKSPKVSAWRNAWFALFATDAIKPLLKPRKGGAPAPRPMAAQTIETPTPVPVLEAPAAHHGEEAAVHGPAEAADSHDSFTLEPRTTH
jgi:hypothetical protein